ncbi:acetyl-CoA carboxylase biotin carboxylase subunit [Cobetia sp. L2A1]|uniref:acetyl-CoA carboxylase biotin carboxylase subunit n=1 Tax=Cobetia sp. L2A1 TaxID=2686360 RepID=UPI00131E5A0F|nr:acetyl/propionyl/methylcrotonyl-CoA carboxylase subunit alpha [Cobetia sp. L2A1]
MNANRDTEQHLPAGCGAIRKLLIANRGEIAVRVMRTARAMGISTVAVYSDADVNALHVREADEAIRLGPASARESYLDIDKVIAAARLSGADAVHPGYGFLSENATFVRALAEAGLVFVGPPEGAIAAMGDKSAAKARMQAASVPLVPGYHGDNQEDGLLKSEADGMGYPVLIKACAGGGGKGMRVVEDTADFQAALESCRRESRTAFGDERMLIEKYLTQPRHVEVQVFCDAYGSGVYLFERDCSVQRRHQKVLEEAPAPGLTSALRREMGEAAVRAAREIGYVGAGTIEFLLDAPHAGSEQHGAFYFMEMNTRLQVEHPVTEMITGEDLVEWQLRIARGEPLPRQQDELRLEGHSFEARLYAEDPDNDFLPATGVLERFRLDLDGAGLDARQVRLDSGVAEGDEVSMHYDPMLAKLITFGPTREQALEVLLRALAALEVRGVTTNRAFLTRLAAHADFRSATLDTRFIERHHASLFPVAELDHPTVASSALLALSRLAEQAANEGHSGQPASPWARRDGWRNGTRQQIRLALCLPHDADTDESSDKVAHVIARRPYASAASTSAHQWQIEVITHSSGETATTTHEGHLDLLAGNAIAITLDGHRRRQQASHAPATGGEVMVLASPQGESRMLWRRADAVDHAQHETQATLNAPMNGTVVAQLVEAGVDVAAGTPLLVMEAMKMEHTMSAPADGQVAQFHFSAGDSVTQGDVLLEFTAHQDAALDEAGSKATVSKE